MSTHRFRLRRMDTSRHRQLQRCTQSDNAVEAATPSRLGDALRYEAPQEKVGARYLYLALVAFQLTPRVFLRCSDVENEPDFVPEGLSCSY